MQLLNIGILKSPLNWLTVLFMVLIGGIALHLIADSLGVNPSKAQIVPSSNTV